ncbi:site-specific DNA-methyltransferase [Limnochorda pilosa]|uniref:DNA methylase N-4/N-6 domain-containing protein n=1 Tax=Limnochorda pilosa TaxID=1555112 RepID=A0A0K2SFY5_LIMPI|nr:site-specific DNA-methyltransferase [Limnochorda pilosa]BAS26018.1 hypothetical protein LIP_0161 [Limnochorda pilosa]
MPAAKGPGEPTDQPEARLVWPGKATPREVLAEAEATQVRFRVAERFDAGDGEPNLLFWGDNVHVAAALLERWRGRIDLVYIDPPFGLQRTLRMGWGSHPSDPLAYDDRWPEGWAGYLQMLYPRLVLIRELLSERGSLYVHMGPQLAPYVRVVLDELFGPGGFRNEIVWRRDAAGKGGKRRSLQWPRNTESILFYTRRPRGYHFEQPSRPLSPRQAAAYRLREPDGRRFRAVQLGNYTETSIRRLEAEGRIYVSPSGRRYKKYYLDEATATVDGLWTDLPGFGTRTAAREHLGYPGQKPEALLERILLASSRPGDWVADLFCGAGTTLAVAERLGRRWIGCDLAPLAVQTCRRRLAPAARRPFEIHWEEAPVRCTVHEGLPPVGVEAAWDGPAVRVRLVPPGDVSGGGTGAGAGEQGWAPEIDGWSLDVGAGSAFRHRWVSFRPYRPSDPPLALEIRSAASGAGERLVVQVADRDGRVFRFHGAPPGRDGGRAGSWEPLHPVAAG